MFPLAQSAPTLPPDWPQGELRPPKPPVEIPAPEPAPLWWPWVVAALVVLLLLATLGVWLRQRHRHRAKPSPPPDYATALDQLAARSPDLADAPFAQELSAQVRRELVDRCRCPLLPLTTAELLAALPSDLATQADPLLRQLDQAKFAAAALPATTRQTLLALARALRPEPPATDSSPIS